VLLVSLFALLLCILSSLAILGIGLQSGVRAYVAGEGLWSRAQKDATIDLASYLAVGKDDDLKRFEEHLRVPAGDREARETLESSRPNIALAEHGLLQGRNHPDDIDALISLFRRFRSLPQIHHAIVTWAQADEAIDDLRSLSARIRTRLLVGPLPAVERDGFGLELQQLNARLTALEAEFSGTLGTVARHVHSILVAAIAGIGIILAGIGALATQHIAALLSRKEAAQRASERRYQDLFERSPAGLYRSTQQGKLLECNSALARLLGYASTEDVLKLSSSDLYLDLPEREAFLRHLHEKRALVNCEVRLKRQGGTPLWGLLNERVIDGEALDKAVLEGSLIDITERKVAEEASHHRASHDTLTELPNRTLFKDRLALAIHHGKRRTETISVMFVDLDYFKKVNDSLGHAAGDELLVQVANRLRSSVRAADTVARFGGDEFMLFLNRSRSPETGLDMVAGKILQAFSEPFVLQGHQIAVSASIGISHYPDDGTDVDTLVINADKALYRAKELGRGNFQYFNGKRT